jgi:LPS sulfotransferase NodH
LDWARDFYTPPWIGRYKSYGFKTKLVDILDPQGFARLLEEKDCRVIQLLRRNSVKAVISTINADRLHKSTGSWNLLKDGDRMPPFAVDFQQFEQMLQERQEWDRELEAYSGQLRLPVITLFYEDLLRDEKAFLQKVFDFIGVSPQPVKGKTIKHTQDNLRDVITNFDELRAKYAGTHYETMFDEVIV